MPDYTAGQARLDIVPDASGFAERLKADLKKIGDKYKIPVEYDTKEADEKLAKTKTEAAKPVKTQLDLDVKAAEDRLRAWRIREQAQKLGIRVEVDTERADLQLRLLRAEAEARSIKLRVDVDKTGLFDGLDGIGADFAKLFSGGLTSPASIVGITGLLPAAASGIGQVAAAIQQLAGAAPVLPGALAGIAAIAGTVKLGLVGVSDAFDAVSKASSGLPKDIEAANQALAGLAPSAQDAVKTAVTLKDELTKALQLPVQQNLFDGLSQSMRGLVDNDLPILQQRLPELASTLNESIKKTLGSLGSDQSKGFLDRILGNTDEATGKLNQSIDPVTHALGQLTASGSNGLPRLADDIDNVANRFDKFITNAANNGDLDRWISNGITGFEHLASTGGHIVDVISDIASAAGGDLLKNLDEVSGRLAHWLDSDKGRAELKQFLDDGKKKLSDIIDIVKNVGPAFGDAFGSAANSVGLVLAPLKLVTDAFNAIPEPIRTALTKGVTFAANPGGGTVGAVQQLLNPSANQSAQDKLNKAINDRHNAAISAPSAPVAPGPAVSPPIAGGAPKNPLDIIAGHARGGILPGYSPGRDDMLVPMSGGEGVIIPTVTRKLGPEGIAAINRGALTGFAGGGIIDQFGNPVTPGTPPGGPAPIAGNPTGTGIVNTVISGVASGVQGPIGNALSLGSSLFGAVQGATSGGGGTGAAPTFMDRLAKVPGIAGLIGSAGSSDPGAALSDWGQQTGQWLGNFAAKTAGGFGTALWQGALGLVGLDNSILSPNNPWFQDATKGFSGATSGLGALSGGPGQGGSGPASVSNTDLASLQQPDVQHLAADRASGTTSSSGSKTAAYTAAPTSGKGAERWRPLVRATLAEYGSQFGITNTKAWEDAIVRQIATESGGNPTAINNWDSNAAAGHPSQGLLQFIPSTFAANNITGGAFLDPAAQIAAVIPYVVHRYGMNASGGPNAIGQGHGYARGGIVGMVPMSGGEGIIDPAITAKLGPEGIAAINRGALTGLAEGGIVPPPYALINPPKPPPNLQPARAIQAQPITPRASAQVPSSANFKQLPAGAVPSPGVPTPSPAPPAQPTAPPPTVAPKDQAPRYTPTTGQLPVTTISGNPADHLDHNLPALDKGIDSGAQAIGQAASTAIAIAAGIAAGAGSSGFSPGASAIGAIGAIGPYVAGLIQEGGKVVKDVANIGSSFLVGTVQPGTTPSQFGETLTAPQNIPQTAQDNRRNYVFNGIDGSRVVDDIRLKDAQDMQAPLARW